MALVNAVTNTVHSLQGERGISSYLLLMQLSNNSVSTDGIESLKSDIKLRRADLDITIKTLTSAYSPCSKLVVKDDVGDVVGTFLQRLQLLPQMRASIDKRSVTAQEAVAFYNSIIVQHMSYTDILSDMVSSKLSLGLAAYVSYVNMKESFGEVVTHGIDAFTEGSFLNIDKYRKFATASMKWKKFRELLVHYASKDISDDILAFANTSAYHVFLQFEEAGLTNDPAVIDDVDDAVRYGFVFSSNKQNHTHHSLTIACFTSALDLQRHIVEQCLLCIWESGRTIARQ